MRWPRAEYGLTDRTDGTKQWTYDGKPLYLWIKDQKPGDMTGDGVKGVWHTVVKVLRAAMPYLDEIEAAIPGLRAFAQALARDRELADDLVQDTLEAALARQAQWRGDGPLRGWLAASS
jgi:hypothetical protein